jgi:hypothetical protein
MISVNMTKAKEIWKDKIRIARDPKLKALDVEFVRALEEGDIDKQAEVTSQKQALRDATADPAIDSATTTQQLKEVQPAGLEVK